MNSETSETAYPSYVAVSRQETFGQSVFYVVDLEGLTSLKRLSPNLESFEIPRTLEHTGRLVDRVLLPESSFHVLAEGIVSIGERDYYSKSLILEEHPRAVEAIKGFLDNLPKVQ
jgi:hypothetical protein